MRTPALHASLALALLAPLALLGCKEPPGPPTPPRRDAGPPVECRGVTPGQLACEGAQSIVCDEAGQLTSRVDCARDGETCVAGFGCVLCVPGSIRCDGEQVVLCNADGTAETAGEVCDAANGLRCSAGGCQPLCELAEAERSYLGCEYLAVPSANSELDSAFEFAIVVANPQLVPAIVTVTRGAAFAATRIIAPGELEVIPLPWVQPLVRPFEDRTGDRYYFSMRVEDGGYRVASDVPVTVHQFNPLSFEAPTECRDLPDSDPSDHRCYSYTNDASLLLPIAALTGSYLVMSRPTHYLVRDGGYGAASGFVSIANPGSEAADVTVRTRSHVIGSSDGSIPELAPGDEVTLRLAPGEVVQLLSGIPERCPAPLEDERAVRGMSYCPMPADYDLTGTEIVSAHRLVVSSGHDCTFVPFNRWACDHLEEQLFPTEALDRSVVAPIGYQHRGEPNLVRVVSAEDANTITFSPAPREGAASVTIDRGELVEVTIDRPTRVTGTGAILAARFFVGQDYSGFGTSGRLAPGDPAMGLLVPDAQWRNRYSFLAPDTYSALYVDVIAPVGARVELDGQVIALRDASETGSATATISITAGVHRLSSSLPIGAHVYGFGRYTSYLAPAGLDLREIGDPL